MQRAELNARWDVAERQISELQVERNKLQTQIQSEYSRNSRVVNATNALEQAIANLNQIHQELGQAPALAVSPNKPKVDSAAGSLVTVPLVSAPQVIRLQVSPHKKTPRPTPPQSAPDSLKFPHIRKHDVR